MKMIDNEDWCFLLYFLDPTKIYKCGWMKLHHIACNSIYYFTVVTVENL